MTKKSRTVIFATILLVMLVATFNLLNHVSAQGGSEQGAEAFKVLQGYKYLQVENQVFVPSARQVIMNTPPTDVNFTMESLNRMQSLSWKITRDPKVNFLRLNKKVAENVVPRVQLDEQFDGMAPLRVWVLAVLQKTENGDVEGVAVVKFYPKKVIVTIITDQGTAYYLAERSEKGTLSRAGDATKEHLNKAKEGLKGILKRRP